VELRVGGINGPVGVDGLTERETGRKLPCFSAGNGQVFILSIDGGPWFMERPTCRGHLYAATVGISGLVLKGRRVEQGSSQA
jgi:hypothetical protein